MWLARHHSALVLASVLTVIAFVGATAYTQRQLMALDALTSTIETNAAPSLEHLGYAGVRLERVRLLLRDALDRSDSDPKALSTARAELRSLEGDIEEYLQLTPLPGEGELWNSTRRDLGRAVQVAESTIRTAEQGDRSGAAMLFHTEADPALDHAAATVLEALQFDVKSSERLAREVAAVRHTTTNEIVVLDILATVVALATGLVAFRFSREHDRLLRRHNALLEERVTDLDRFAGRVAHDILSPLDAVGFGLALAAKSVDPQAHVDRAQRAVERVKQLVQGLLAFSRAGTSAADARCRVDVVLADVLADWSGRAREVGVTLMVEPCDPIEVACSPGVLTSMIQNLVLNAIKYMGDRPSRRVAVRARRTTGRVRIEVADTGPGISSEFRTRMFEPFVRGADAPPGGLGLGLATVKRLVEAHGGTVHVESTVGVGTTVRIDVPVATPVTDDAATES